MYGFTAKTLLIFFLQQCAVSTIFRMVGNQAGSLVGWLGRKKNSRPHFEWALNPIGGGGVIKAISCTEHEHNYCTKGKLYVPAKELKNLI